jgi:hypothetical protein
MACSANWEEYADYGDDDNSKFFGPGRHNKFPGIIPGGSYRRPRHKALVDPSSQVVMQNDLFQLEESTGLGFNIELDPQGFGDVGCGKDTPYAIGG